MKHFRFECYDLFYYIFNIIVLLREPSRVLHCVPVAAEARGARKAHFFLSPRDRHLYFFSYLFFLTTVNFCGVLLITIKYIIQEETAKRCAKVLHIIVDVLIPHQLLTLILLKNSRDENFLFFHRIFYFSRLYILQICRGSNAGFYKFIYYHKFISFIIINVASDK